MDANNKSVHSDPYLALFTFEVTMYKSVQESLIFISCFKKKDKQSLNVNGLLWFNYPTSPPHVHEMYSQPMLHDKF